MARKASSKAAARPVSERSGAAARPVLEGSGAASGGGAVPLGTGSAASPPPAVGAMGRCAPPVLLRPPGKMSAIGESRRSGSHRRDGEEITDDTSGLCSPAATQRKWNLVSSSPSARRSSSSSTTALAVFRGLHKEYGDRSAALRASLWFTLCILDKTDCTHSVAPSPRSRWCSQPWMASPTGSWGCAWPRCKGSTEWRLFYQFIRARRRQHDGERENAKATPYSARPASNGKMSAIFASAEGTCVAGDMGNYS